MKNKKVVVGKHSMFFVDIPKFVKSEINAELVKAAIEYDVKDFVFEYSLFGKKTKSSWVDHNAPESMIKSYLKYNGQNVMVNVDISDSDKLKKFRKRVMEISKEFKITKFDMVYDGGRIFKFNVK